MINMLIVGDRMKHEYFHKCNWVTLLGSYQAITKRKIENGKVVSEYTIFGYRFIQSTLTQIKQDDESEAHMQLRDDIKSERRNN